MAQHDYDIANQSFPSFRSDLNSVLEAINTSNSGTSRPSSAVAGTIWLDTTSATTPTLKFYDGADDISLATLDYSANTVNWLDSTVSVDIVGDTTPQLGGNLDVNGNSIISVSNGNITFTPDGTGKVIIDGLSHPTADGTAGQFMKTDGAGNLSFDTVDLTNLSATNLTSGTVPIARLGASGTKDATTFLRGDNTFAEAGGGDLTPAFHARLPSTQALVGDTNTKINFSTEIFDTDSAYDTSNKRFTVPSGEGGKYMYYITLNHTYGSSRRITLKLFKNGSGVHQAERQTDSRGFTLVNFIDLSVGDYIEAYYYLHENPVSGVIDSGTDQSFFGGFKLLGV